MDVVANPLEKGRCPREQDRVVLGALVVVVLVAFAAGCGSDSDQGQARQEATKKIELKVSRLSKRSRRRSRLCKSRSTTSRRR